MTPKNDLITPGRLKAIMTRKTRYPKTLPMNLKYDLFAVHGDIPARFYHSFAFFILQAYMISVKCYGSFNNLQQENVSNYMIVIHNPLMQIVEVILTTMKLP